MKKRAKKPIRHAVKNDPFQVPLKARRHSLVAEMALGLKRCGVNIDDKNVVRIAVGLSGGADSVALLIACVIIAGRRSSNIGVGAVHVHHHLRRSADGDARFVVDLCARLGVSCSVKHVFPSKMPGNVAANARVLRYQALTNAAMKFGASFVAVAHHGDDQIETMIAALGRGAGLDGLSGMPWSRALNSSVTLIRPLLAIRRSECEEFCRAAGVSWRNDPSNSDAKKVRGRLRRDVLPVLEELWPDAARRAASTADLIRAARTALDDELERTFGRASGVKWSRERLQSRSAPVIAAGLRRAALHHMPGVSDELNQRHLNEATTAILSCDRSPRRYDWPRGLQLMVTSKSVSIAMPAGPISSIRQSVRKRSHG